jgi:hypothetical protein
MKQTVTGAILERDVTPLVRPTRSQVEVDYLPPYGDPEVNIPGEVATYLTLGAATVTLLDRLAE